MSESEPLTTIMAAGPMPLGEVVRIVRGAAEALREPHGEICPSAIGVSPDVVSVGASGVHDRSRYGQYAAPERLLGGPPTAAGDVFSLAAIAFHALAGRPAFRGGTTAEVMLAICSDQPLDLVAYRAEVPRELAVFLSQCLSRDSASRPATPEMFSNALERMTAQVRWPGRRVLIADDDAEVRQLFTHIVTRVGVETDIVSSGRDAIAALKSRRYDVAMLDLNMPRLSGWEVLDYLRARYDEQPPNLFIVTGFADQAISSADSGVVSGVIYKPFASDEIASLVSACLSGGPVDLSSILQKTGHRHNEPPRPRSIGFQ